MPSNYTEHYQLNQWAAEDQVQRVDFNADNAKIDAAIKALDTKASAKAEQSALDAEVQARQSADSAINTKINTINATLPKKGNCQLYYMTYTGDGAATKTLTFPGKPLFIFAMCSNLVIRTVYGLSETMCRTGGEGGARISTAWSGNSITWSSANGSYSPNQNGKDYFLIALMDAAGAQ